MTADSGAPRAGSDKSAAGRPRDARIDAAIIAATRELLLESGYAALTLSAIAARAGTTTAALYRRWSGKAQLVHEAVLQIDPHPVPHQPPAPHQLSAPDLLSARDPLSPAGDPRSEIRMLVETIRAIFDRPEVRVALPGLIADTVADPELHESMLARLTVGLDAFEARSGRSRRDGDLLPVLVEVVAGSAIFRLLIRRDASLDEDWVEEMTRLLAGHPAHTGL